MREGVRLDTKVISTTQNQRCPNIGEKMARDERFELPTDWFEASYSIQLSYGRNNCSYYLPDAELRVL